MDLLVWIVVIVTVVVLGGVKLVMYFGEKHAWQKLIDDYERRNPGKCCVCAFWRWGREVGLEDTPRPPSHMKCPEK